MQVAKDKLDQMEEIDLSLGNVEKKDIVSIVENYIKENEEIIERITSNKRKPGT